LKKAELAFNDFTKPKNILKKDKPEAKQVSQVFNPNQKLDMGQPFLGPSAGSSPSPHRAFMARMQQNGNMQPGKSSDETEKKQLRAKELIS